MCSLVIQESHVGTNPEKKNDSTRDTQNRLCGTEPGGVEQCLPWLLTLTCQGCFVLFVGKWKFRGLLTLSQNRLMKKYNVSFSQTFLLCQAVSSSRDIREDPGKNCELAIILLKPPPSHRPTEPRFYAEFLL